jgi:hypothetical protein
MGKRMNYIAKKTYEIGSLAANTPGFLARGTKKAAIATYNTTSAVDRAINKKLAIKIKDSRIYQENNSEVFVMNDDLISKNLQDLGGQINKYYNKNRELNRKV